MKKGTKIVVWILACLILTGAIGVYLLVVKAMSLDKESKEYVDEVTPKILENLNQETLFQYASDELKKSATQEEFDKIFKFFGKLGKFKEYRDSKGGANISITTGRGKQITAAYEAHAEFENGPAVIKVAIIKKNDKWQVVGFHINSMALAN